MKLKKFTKKDRYGNMTSFEFDVADGQMEVPPMLAMIPEYDHPGEPKGTDTVPAWLTPGEFVVNKEATDMYGPIIEKMNDHGRKIQDMKPEYANEGKKIENKKAIYSYLKENHFPNNDKAIAGILGQIDHETGGTFNWKEKEKGGFGGHGLFMFTKGSKNNPRQFESFQKYLNDNNRSDSMEAQLDYFVDSIRKPGAVPNPDGSGYYIGAGNAAVLNEMLADPDIPLTAEQEVKMNPEKFNFDSPGPVPAPRNNLSTQLMARQINPGDTQSIASRSEDTMKAMNEIESGMYNDPSLFSRVFGGLFSGSDQQKDDSISNVNEQNTKNPYIPSSTRSRGMEEGGVVYANLGQNIPRGLVDFPSDRNLEEEINRLLPGAEDMVYKAGAGRGDSDDLGSATPIFKDNVPTTNNPPVPPVNNDLINMMTNDDGSVGGMMVNTALFDDKGKRRVPVSDSRADEMNALALEQEKEAKKKAAKDLMAKAGLGDNKVITPAGSLFSDFAAMPEGYAGTNSFEDLKADKAANAAVAESNLNNAVETGNDALIESAAAQVEDAGKGVAVVNITEATNVTNNAEQKSKQAVNNVNALKEKLNVAENKKNDAINSGKSQTVINAYDQVVANTKAELDAAENNVITTQNNLKAAQENENNVIDSSGLSASEIAFEDGADDTSTTSKSKEVKISDTLNALIDQNKNAEGPSSDQPGKNANDADVKKAGEEESNKKDEDGKTLKDKTKSFLGNLFGSLFDSQELGRMAVMYLGSRAMGYSHEGSLAFAGKNYINRVDAKVAAAEKFARDNVGKFKLKSLELYKKTRKLTDLEPIGAPVERQGSYKTFYGKSKTGENIKIQAEKVKVGDNFYWHDSKGNIVDGTIFKENAYDVVGTKEYNDRVRTTTKQLAEIIKENRLKISKENKPLKYATDITPTEGGGQAAEWAIKNGVPAERVYSLVAMAMEDANQMAMQTGERIKSIEPFLNSLVIREQTSMPDLFVSHIDNKGKDNEQKIPVSTESFQTLNDDIYYVMQKIGGKGSQFNLTNQYYTQAATDWMALDEDTKKSWNGKARKGIENGFMLWVQNDLATFLAKQ